MPREIYDDSTISVLQFDDRYDPIIGEIINKTNNPISVEVFGVYFEENDNQTVFIDIDENDHHSMFDDDWGEEVLKAIIDDRFYIHK